jgi:hypothetical protein
MKEYRRTEIAGATAGQRRYADADMGTGGSTGH